MAGPAALLWAASAQAAMRETLSEADCASSSVRFMRLCSAFSSVCSSSSPPEEKRSVMSATIWPTMPPTSVCVPAGMTSPSTVRFRTDAPLSTRLKRPYSEQLSVRRRPVILCPCPSKSPRKIGIEAAAPSASMSSVSTTVSPLNRYPRRSAWRRPAADAESRWRRFRPPWPLTVLLISPVTRPTTNTRSRNWCVRAAVGMEMLVLSASPPPSSRICGRTNSTNSIEMIVPRPRACSSARHRAG